MAHQAHCLLLVLHLPQRLCQAVLVALKCLITLPGCFPIGVSSLPANSMCDSLLNYTASVAFLYLFRDWMLTWPPSKLKLKKKGNYAVVIISIIILKMCKYNAMVMYYLMSGVVLFLFIHLFN